MPCFPGSFDFMTRKEWHQTGSVHKGLKRWIGKLLKEAKPFVFVVSENTVLKMRRLQ